MADLIEEEGLLCEEVFNCNISNCNNAAHIASIDSLFEKTKAILLKSTDEYSFVKSNKFRVIPGWNEYVKHLHKEARRCFQEWRNNGKPPNGPYLDNMKSSRSQFKAALQKCKDDEEKIKQDKLLNNLENKDHKHFWNEVYNVKKHNNVTAASIDGSRDPKIICNTFSEKFKGIFAMRNRNPVKRNKKTNKSESHNVNISFSKADIKEGIKELKCSIGMDGIHSNHLKYCDDLFSELISLLFSTFTKHEYAPQSLIRGMIIPTVKDKFGDVESSNNYRPIMSSSVILKLFEYCLLKKISPYLEISDAQHGFRPNHSTVTACTVLKETIYNYRKSKSDVYACFIDISKAFDSVDHEILMNRLIENGVPSIYVDIIKYWYGNQIVQVKYLSCISDEWLIQNGVRQGGVLSGLFFSLYIDSLLKKINNNKYGCKLGIFKSNIIAYADDIVLMASSALSLQILINEALKEANNLKLTFNKDKSKWMVFRATSGKQDYLMNIKMDNETVERVYEFKYLGYIIRSDLANTDDMQRALKKFYCEFNSILRNFSFTDSKVKLFLFKYYCLQIYGADLWIGNKGCAAIMKKFSVAYHKAIKKLLNLSTHESNHYACQEAEMLTFEHFINKKRFMTVLRMFQSPCVSVAKNLPFFKVSSSFFSEISDIFFKKYSIDDLVNNDKDAIISRIWFVQNHEETMR